MKMNKMCVLATDRQGTSYFVFVETEILHIDTIIIPLIVFFN